MKSNPISGKVIKSLWVLTSLCKDLDFRYSYKQRIGQNTNAIYSDMYDPLALTEHAPEITNLPPVVS